MIRSFRGYWIEDDGSARIRLTRGLAAIVDADVAEELAQWNWFAHATKSGLYAARTSQSENQQRAHIYMHRALLGADQEQVVDHANGFTLDNRRSNLRLCSHPENVVNCRMRANNTSGFKGVWYVARKRRWAAMIQAKGRRKNLGLFKTPEAAAKAYDALALVWHGEFAMTNERLGLLPPTCGTHYHLNERDER